jgi:hypothetical protein
MGNYPSHRPTPWVYWYAHANASIDDALPPKTAERTRRIREVFVRDFGGRATIRQVGDRCDDLGLLDGFSTHRSCTEAIMKALRPIATHNVWESAWRPAPVSAPLPLG